MKYKKGTWRAQEVQGGYRDGTGRIQGGYLPFTLPAPCLSPSKQKNAYCRTFSWLVPTGRYSDHLCLHTFSAQKYSLTFTNYHTKSKVW